MVPNLDSSQKTKGETKESGQGQSERKWKVSSENAVSITLEPGFIVTRDSNGKGIMRYPIASVLRAGDIPSLTYEQVQAITSLANLVAVLIRTLIDRGILDEQFMEDGDYDLNAIVQVIEDMGGDYAEPDISVD